jgi:DMSO/TMAO reductase YedYZ molybdopterin-dependent catalytic subunit
MHQDMSRRTLLKGGGAALAGMAALPLPASADGPSRHPQEVVLPWLDQPEPTPSPLVVIKWEELDSWLTPNDEFFVVYHYGIPPLDAQRWQLDITGLVSRPQTLRLADLKARPRREQAVTLECSGDHGFPFFTGAVSNARWAGTPLAPILQRAGLRSTASEVVFYGADSGVVTIRDNAGVLRAGNTGTVAPDGTGGLDLTITERFARSMSIEEALAPENLLAYEMNGAPLPPAHGFPVRLIAPGWYGVANVKWLTRIEVVDQRYAGRFMARDYVTIREQQQRDGETLWTFANVNHDRLKSAPAKVIRRGDRYTVMAVAWGAPIADVEVRIDNGPWMGANLDRHAGSRTSQGRDGFAWSFWTFAWGRPAAGEHTVTTRAFDFDGNVQPPPSDTYLASRVTYWENNGQITRRVRIP